MLDTMIGNNSPLDRMRTRQAAIVRSDEVAGRGQGVGGHRGKRMRAADARNKKMMKTRRSSHEPGGRMSGMGIGLSPTEERNLRQILAEPMDYINSDEFTKKDAEYRIFDMAPEIQRPDVSWYRPLMDDASGPRSQGGRLKGSSSTPLLTGAQERVLFLKYNYARHRVAELQMEIGPNDPTPEQAREVLKWYRVASELRDQIAETNLALVLAMAKRTRMSEVDFADLVSEGNMALLRSVDKFDCGRGFKFSTYACRAILKAFSRQGMKLSKYRQRFPTEFDPAMEQSDHLETLRRTHELETAAELKHIVQSNEADLSDVEQTVIEHRFGLDGKREGPQLTLEQVGQIIGVTKERVRQIQNKALEKIRLRLEEKTAPPGQEAGHVVEAKPEASAGDAKGAEGLSTGADERAGSTPVTTSPSAAREFLDRSSAAEHLRSHRPSVN